MVQEFYVLKCFSCELYQVHIVKKVKKWACKVCGSKQSVVKIYGQGSAKDCRQHVQKLNILFQSSRNENGDIQSPELDEDASTGYENYNSETNVVEESDEENVYLEENDSKKPVSKWTKYLEPRNDKVLGTEQSLTNGYEYNEHNSITPPPVIKDDDFRNGLQLEQSLSFTTVIPTEKKLNQPNDGDFKNKDTKILKFFSEDELDIDTVLNL